MLLTFRGYLDLQSINAWNDASVHAVFDIHLWSLKPVACTDDPPNHSKTHRSGIHYDTPIH